MEMIAKLEWNLIILLKAGLWTFLVFPLFSPEYAQTHLALYTQSH